MNSGLQYLEKAFFSWQEVSNANQHDHLMDRGKYSHVSYFISYSCKNLDFAQKVVDLLAANNLDTCIDWKSISQGEDWRR